MCHEHYDDVNVEYRTDISGWVATDGRFWGKDEHMARWTSCKYVTCKKDGCNNSVEKHWVRCEDCRDKKAKEKWESSEKRPLTDSDIMYYSEAFDKYFQEWEEVEEFCDDGGVEPKELLLYHCERESPPQVDIDCLYEDVTPDGLDTSDMINDEIDELVERLNRAMNEHPVNCFFPSKVGVQVPEKE